MNRSSFALTLAFLLFAVLGCIILAIDLGLLGPSNGEENNATSSHSSPSSSTSSPATTTPPVTSTPPVIDGTINAGEYAHAVHDDVTKMDLYWTLSGDTLYMAIHSPGTGWEAVGIAPDGPMMKGGDILMGYVEDGKAVLEDQYGDTQYTHKMDTDLGGKDSIISFAGSENDAGTSLEFERNEKDLDQYDKPINLNGSTFVMLAWADHDNWTSYHGKDRSIISVNFTNPEAGSK